LRSLVAPRLALRIDRLARRAHRFHRFAHHPLCDRYAGELLQLRGRARVCRGCTLFAAGGVAGVVAGITLRPSLIAAFAGLGVAAALWALGLRWRGSKIASRLAPAGALGFAVGGGPWCLVAAVGVGVLLAAAYRRRGPDRSPCAACPERSGPAPCTGMREIVRAERAFQRMSGRWLRHA
jgi:hypothetical protein